MLVKEALEFQQGGNPYDKLNTGKYDNNYDFKNPKNDDNIELLENIYDTQYMDSESLKYNGESLTTLSILKYNLDLKYDKNQIFIFNDDEWYANNGSTIDIFWVIKYSEIFKKIRN